MLATDAKKEIDLGGDMWLVWVAIAELREQDVNAHVMQKVVFERLAANIKRRGMPESFPYCIQRKEAESWGKAKIISGHHRVRAARAAGLTHTWILADRSALTRSQEVAAQLAHNSLVGYDDPDLLRQLLSSIDNPEDLLATGLPPDMLPSPTHEAMAMFTPRVNFDYKTVTFAFLPHQLDNFVSLIDELQGKQDLVVVDTEDKFKPFILAAAEFAKVRDIRSGSTAVAVLIEFALRVVRDHSGRVEDAEKAGLLCPKHGIVEPGHKCKDFKPREGREDEPAAEQP